MLTDLVAFALSFAVAAVLTPLLRALAPVIGGVDRAVSSRKVHTTPIPRLGGIAIVVGFYVPVVGVILYTTSISALFLKDPARVTGLFVGGLAIALLGLYDDLRGANAKVKLTVQVAVAVLMYALGYRVDGITTPFAEPISLGLLSGPFTVLWIVGIINAMNLIDGLDGLAGGVAAIVVGLTFAVAFNRPDFLMCLFMASLGGAIVGFLIYNFNPATIFMGDTGSMFLGFVLAVTTVQSSSKSSAAVAMLVPIVALGLPIMDTLLAMARRALRGRPLFSADKEHIHHKLLALGLTHRQAVLLLYGVCLLLAAVAFAMTYANSRQVALLLGVLGVLSAVGMRLLGYRIDRETMKENAAAREKNQNLRSLVRDVGRKLREADRVEAVWDSVKYVGSALKAKEMTLSLVVQEGGGEQVRNVLSWRPETPPAGPRRAPACKVTMELERPGASGGNAGEAPGRAFGELQVVWADGRRAVERDEEIALEMLADHMETALERIGRGGPAQDAGEDAVEAGPT